MYCRSENVSEELKEIPEKERRTFILYCFVSCNFLPVWNEDAAEKKGKTDGSIQETR